MIIEDGFPVQCMTIKRVRNKKKRILYIIIADGFDINGGRLKSSL